MKRRLIVALLLAAGSFVGCGYFEQKPKSSAALAIQKPKSSAALVIRGDGSYEKKEYDKAVADYSEAIRISPNFADAFSHRGKTYCDKKEYDRAIKDFTEAIRLTPLDADAFVDRGIAYNGKKEYSRAVADYDQAIRLGHRRARQKLAWLLATCPKDDVRDGKRAVELATKDYEVWQPKATLVPSYIPPETLGTLAAAYAECGDFKQAVKWQQKAIEAEFADYKTKHTLQQRLQLYQNGKPFRDE
jgi:tetratricopeptide (TPR) repeat protein